MAGILSIPNMQNLLANASLELDAEKKAQLEEIHESPVNGANLSLFSTINTVFLSNKNTSKLDFPVTFYFSHNVSPWVGREDQPHCSPHRPSVVFIFPFLSILLLL